jgi:hypothetical protein
MGLQRFWENDTKTVLRVESSSAWGWVEYDSFIDDLVAEIKKLDHVVHVILLPFAKFPQGSPLPHLRRASRILPENVGKIIMVGGNLLFRSVNIALIKVNPKMSKRVIFVASIDEAWSLLKSLDVAQT